MLPEIEAYQRAVDAAEQTFREESRVVEQSYNDASPELRNDTQWLEAYYQRSAAPRTRFNDAKTEAFATLRRILTDPVGKFVLEGPWDNGYTSEVMAVLRHLPLTLEQMDDLARGEEWCSVYRNRYRDQMIEAGVFADVKPWGSTPARQALDAWLRDNLTTRARTEVRALVQDVVAELEDPAPADAVDTEQDAVPAEG